MKEYTIGILKLSSLFVVLTLGLLFAWSSIGFFQVTVTTVSVADGDLGGTNYEMLSSQEKTEFRKALGKISDTEQTDSAELWDSTKLTEYNSIQLDGEVYKINSETKVQPPMASFLFGIGILIDLVLFLGILLSLLDKSLKQIQSKVRNFGKLYPNKAKNLLENLDLFDKHKIGIMVVLTVILFAPVMLTISSQSLYYAEKIENTNKDVEVLEASELKQNQKHELNELITSDGFQPRSTIPSDSYIKSDGELYKITQSSVKAEMTQDRGYAIGVIFICTLFSGVLSVAITYISRYILQLTVRNPLVQSLDVTE